MTVLTYDPDSPYGQALAQREAGDLDGAIATLRAAAQTSLHDASVAVTLAQMYAETGQLAPARRWFHHAMKLAPDDLPVRLGFAVFLAEGGRIDEARTILTSAAADARAELGNGQTRTSEEWHGIWTLVGHIECNLARAHFECGDRAAARALLTPWLTDPDLWGLAHNLLADIIERDGLDPKREAEAHLAAGHASPYMVCHLLEQALIATPTDFAALDRVIAGADALFPFEWHAGEPEIELALTHAKHLFAEAVMRDQIDPKTCPRLSAMIAPRRRRRTRRKEPHLARVDTSR